MKNDEDVALAANEELRLETVERNDQKDIEVELDEEEDYEEDEWAPGEYGYTDFIGSDKWEDQKQLADIKRMKNIPDEWFIIKISNFNGSSFSDMIEWCEQNCSHEFKKVGWSSGCSKTVGMALENEFEALMFKMRFV